jgi:hypothetical protein
MSALIAMSKLTAMSLLRTINPINTLATSIILLLMLLSPDSSAHNRSQSFSKWTFNEQQVSMVFTIKAREVTRLMAAEILPAETILLNHLQNNVRVKANSLPCPIQGKAKPLSAATGYLRASLNFNCEPSTDNMNHDIQLDSFFWRSSIPCSLRPYRNRPTGVDRISFYRCCAQPSAQSTTASQYK